MLTIQGRVSKKTIRNLPEIGSIKANQDWFFVDYSNDEVSINRKFDVLLKGEDKSLVSSSASMKLIQITDQFGHALESIPQGYKTICKFEFEPSIPAPVKKLKTLDAWDYNSESVFFETHEEIKLNDPDYIIRDLLSIAFIEAKKSLAGSSKKLFSGDVVDLFVKRFNAQPKNAAIILIHLEQLGKIRRTQNDEIEFAEA